MENNLQTAQDNEDANSIASKTEELLLMSEGESNQMNENPTEEDQRKVKLNGSQRKKLRRALDSGVSRKDALEIALKPSSPTNSNVISNKRSNVHLSPENCANSQESKRTCNNEQGGSKELSKKGKSWQKLWAV